MALLLAPGAWATADGVVILGGGGGGGAAATLAATLAVGNTTGGTGIEVSAADPILLNENATVPGGAPGAAKGTVWVRSDTPNVLIYTDDAGTDIVLGTAHTGDVVGPAGATDEALARYNTTTGLLIQDSTVLVDDTGNMSGLESVLVDHTATENDDFAVKVMADAAGFSDVKAVDVNFITGAIAASDNEECVFVNIDESASTGGRVSAFEVLATAEGSAEVDALEVGAGVHPIKQISGTFGDMDSALNIAVDVLAALSSGGAGNITGFANDNDTMTFGDTAQFEELEFILDTGASGPGIAPTFEYSITGTAWQTFGPADGTDGFRNTGVMAWLLTDIPTWDAASHGGEYKIRITRTRNSLTTSPILDLVQREVGTEFAWTADGNLEILGVQLADKGAPANPGAGLGELYKKTGDDGIFWKPDAAGGEVDLTDTNDPTAIHDDVAGEISSIAQKAVPTGADFILIEDAAAGNVKKHIVISTLPAAAPAAHAASHSDGGSDEITIENLATSEVPTTTVLQSDGAGGLVWNALAAGGGGTELDANATSENLSCSRTAETPTVDVAQPGQVNLGSENVASHGTDGAYASILGGLNGIVNGSYSTVVGGEDNDITIGGSAGVSTHNLIGGGDTNKITNNATSASADIKCSAILSGANNTLTNTATLGRDLTHSVICGGQFNQVQVVATLMSFHTIGGGYNNIISGGNTHGFIGGGNGNALSSASGDSSTIVGGAANTLSASGTDHFIGGGTGNTISGTANFDTLTGGNGNTISGADYAFLGGGSGCTISGDYGVIAGGQSNSIVSGATNCGILGGKSCTITNAGADYSLILGANIATISATANNNVILGGATQLISGGSQHSTIVGGLQNDITGATKCVAMGYRAQCNHGSTLVFGDSAVADVASVESDQVLFGVQNGVRVSHTTEEDGAVKVVSEAATTDATVTTLWNRTLDDNTAIYVSAKVVCMETDGTDRNVYEKRILVYRDGAGALVQGAEQTIVEIESDTAWACILDVDTNDVRLRITGFAATNINWRSTVEFQQVS
jgi:hypothetical protein